MTIYWRVYIIEWINYGILNVCQDSHGTHPTPTETGRTLNDRVAMQSPPASSWHRKLRWHVIDDVTIRQYRVASSRWPAAGVASGAVCRIDERSCEVRWLTPFHRRLPTWKWDLNIGCVGKFQTSRDWTTIENRSAGSVSSCRSSVSSRWRSDRRRRARHCRWRWAVMTTLTDCRCHLPRSREAVKSDAGVVTKTCVDSDLHL